uniref:NADH dehydrogenase subunit 6 n=1 Tax=Vasdavidius concursus TaxID=290153 RepID=Q5URP8_9HEMI|nr:NADH dehydrogenase subunit 6 [Vasdavidius concursus]
MTLWMNPLILLLLFCLFLFYIVSTMGLILNFYFFSYVLFLLFMSGLIIMLMYVSSVLINEKFYLNFNLKILMMLFFMFFFISGKVFLVSPKFYNYFLVLGEFYEVFKVFLFPSNIYFLFFVGYLFFCLVMIFEILKKSKGPLRFKI